MKFLILLCVVLLSSMLAYAGGDVFFASNLKGNLRIYNKDREVSDIRNCRYNVPNNTVYCEVNVYYTYRRCAHYEWRYCVRFEDVSGHNSYRLRIPITSIEYLSNEQCGLKYGSTFKYTYLHAKNSSTNKYQNTQTLCTCNDNILTGNLPSTLYYSSPKQRFQFVTSSGCKFNAYYDKITTTKID